MKKDVKHDLARRYAQACVNIFGDQMHYNDCVALQSAADFLRMNRRIITFLQIPLIEDAIKVDAFERIADAYKLPAWTRSLFSVLLADKRTYLLGLTLDSIALIYVDTAAIELFTISSAHELSAEQRDTCVAFLSRSTNKKIIAQYEQDESLIAGICMQSNVSLWEHSVKKQLRALHHYFCPVEGDYDS